MQGRKDVGGIVGQMEPFLEIQYLSDKLKELDTETDKFLDMLDATQKDVSSYSKTGIRYCQEYQFEPEGCQQCGKFSDRDRS